MGKTVEDYFWRRVEKNGPLHPALRSRCWLWHGDPRHGYGRFSYTKDGEQRQVAAHRFSWELANERPAGSLHVLHKCDNSVCVNPKHLYVGTPQQNMLDAVSRRRLNPARGEWSAHAKLTEVQVVSLREDRAGGMGVAQLSKKYKISTTVAAMIYRGMTWKHVGGPIQLRAATPSPKLSSKDAARLVREYQAGVLSGALMARFNISNGTVIATLRRYGVKSRSCGKPPSLTSAGVKQIRKMYSQQKTSMQAIAEQFGVSIAVVHRAIHGPYAPQHGI